MEYEMENRVLWAFLVAYIARVGGAILLGIGAAYTIEQGIIPIWLGAMMAAVLAVIVFGSVPTLAVWEVTRKDEE